MSWQRERVLYDVLTLIPIISFMDNKITGRSPLWELGMTLIQTIAYSPIVIISYEGIVHGLLANKFISALEEKGITVKPELIERMHERNFYTYPARWWYWKYDADKNTLTFYKSETQSQTDC